MKKCYWTSCFVLLAALLGFTANGWGLCIYAELIGFDVHNFTDQQVNDFTLTLEGISCNDIHEFYPIGYDSLRCWEDADGTHIKWYFYSHPVGPDEWKHFGIALEPGVSAPTVTFAAWTWNCEPVAYVAFPWQRWEITGETSIDDMIDWNITCGPGVYIIREAGRPFVPIGISDLLVNDPLVIASDWWFADPHERVLDPLITPLWLGIQVYGEPAELVKYQVIDYTWTEMLVVLSEAMLDYGPSATEQTTWGRIKALYE